MGWYNASWSHRAQIDIDPAYVDEAVPVIPVYLSGMDATWWANVASDGDDIIVTQSDGTTLRDYYLVSIDTGTSTGLIMINVDGYLSTSATTTLYIYAGNSGASAGSTTATFTGTGYVGVYFPGESTSDASGGGRTLTANNTPGTTAAAGFEVDAATYNGTNQSHSATAAVTTWPVTIETIARTASDSADNNMSGLGDTSGGILRLWFAGTGADKARSLAIDDSSGMAFPVSPAAFSVNTWHLVTATSASNDHDVYLDDGGGGGSTGASASASFTSFYIGAVQWGSVDEGAVDVVYAAISDSVRSVDYITTMFDAWFTSAFRTYGATEDQPASGDTGWVEFSTAAQVASTAIWTNKDNALTSLVTYASANPGEDEQTYQLDLTNASGLSGVTGTITSAEVEIAVTGEDTGTDEIQANQVQFVYSGSTIGANKGTATQIGDAELNFLTFTMDVPTAAQATHSTFGVRLQFTNVGTDGNALVKVYRVRVRIQYSAGGNVTGTGALTAPAASVSGSGKQTQSGTGALTGPVSTVSGSGHQAHVSSGSLTAPAAEVSGSGKQTQTGTGALTAPAATVSGTGSQTITGTGALTAPAAEVDGSGTASAGNITGTGALTAPASEISGAGTQTISGTGALTAPAATVAGSGTVASTDVEGTGALTAPPGRVAGFGIVGKTGTGALTAPAAEVSGAGKQTITGTGALTAPAATVSGTGVNSPPNVVGTGALTAPVAAVSGQGYIGIPSEVTAADLEWYLTGAAKDGESQRDPHASLGGYRSGVLVESMTWDTQDPMIGIEIIEVSGGNGRGVGALAATVDGKITWTPPGGLPGLPVSLANGDEVTAFGFQSGAFIRLRRFLDVPLQGTHAVTCIDLYNNAVGMENVPSADAVSGAVYYRAFLGRNRAPWILAVLQFWIDPDADGTLAIAVETPSSGAIQTIADENTAPTGLTWSSATTAATGLQVVGVASDEMIGLWVRRTIAADSEPGMSFLTAIRYQFTNLLETFENALRGRYRIARTDYAGDGVWIGQDESPDLSAEPDEFFTSTPHTTSLGLATGHMYHCLRRTRNKYGAWSQNVEETLRYLNASGTSDPTAPSSPSNVMVTQNSDDEAVVTAIYEPAVDGDNRAEIWVVWLNMDDSNPDPDLDTPYGYVQMGRRKGIESLRFTDTGNSLLDGTPLSAVVRTRRLVVGSGEAFAPDTTQLPASGAGTIVVATELADWASSGYLKTVDIHGNLLEVVQYTSLVVGLGISTFTVLSGGRGLWGTTAQATTTTTMVYEVAATDSENTAASTGTIDALAPGRSRGIPLFGSLTGQVQDPVAGPDGVTEEYIDAPNNIYLLLGEGWTELWIDTVLVWKVFADQNAPTQQSLYIPTEWDVVMATVSGAGTSDVFEAASATDLYINVSGTRRLHIDATAMTITVSELSITGSLPDVAPQESSWSQYAGSLLTVWDPAYQDYRPYLQLTADGVLNSEFEINMTLDQSGVEAL